MDRIFKIRCSQIGKIMGKIGLTEAQLKTMNELQERSLNGKPLTDIMKKNLSELKDKHANPELPDTAKTFLHKWYAGDDEDISSKYLDKGNICEHECIDFAVKVLNLGFALKNDEGPVSNEFFTSRGCDVKLSDTIIDTKCPWNIETLHANVTGIDSDYEWQGRGYMHLYGKEKFILFFGLMDTPADVCFQEDDISYSHLPDDERWIAYSITHDQSKVDEIIERVKMCRDYLEGYDKLIKSKIGQIL